MASLNRIAMAKASRVLIRSLNPENLDVAEISGKWGRNFPFRSYRKFRYPEYDVCLDPFVDEDGAILQFDLILANQVWEHLDRPYRATQNIQKMLRPGGYFWVSSPFHVPFHAAPNDCSRWSARGLKNLLIEAGFQEANVQSWQWGNRNAALRNLETDKKWPPEYDADKDSLKNDPGMPIISWALARKSKDA